MNHRAAIIALTSHEDPRGKLVVIEGARDLPFEIARAYYIVASEDAERGFHAHRTLEQMLVCVSGSCQVAIDDGTERREVLLERPDQGLYVGPMVWHEMRRFAPGSVLLAFASDHYNEADYIRDYGEFLASLPARCE